MNPPTSAVFSGAGISGDAPAGLPRGFGLRDDVLKLMHAAARQLAPHAVDDHDLRELLASPRKLEVVLGRLWGTVGPDALHCLLALHLTIPNEAHLLAALHLARGGLHVTLNFDIGIELAHALLTGEATLPPTAPPDFHRLLPQWQRLVPPNPPPLQVVASHRQFVDWVDDGRPPALLKVHGSLTFDQQSLLDVVVVDIDELGQLPPPRRAAIDTLSDADTLLITGYSGADPDVYEPLLTAAERPRSSWRCYSLDTTSPVRTDAPAHGIDLHLGPPAGLATTALLDLINLPTSPAWPQLTAPGDTYQQRFDQWATWFQQRHPPAAIAQAWAWLLADLGDHDTAEAILSVLTNHHPNPSALLRHAEVLYTRARGDDRDRAATLFHRLADTPTLDRGTRYHCLLRSSDVARGRAIRNGGALRAIPHLVRAVDGPLRVLIATRAGRRDSELAADAYRALQQTGLRTLEHLAGSTPKRLWPALAIPCRILTRAGRRAETLATNGNRRALARQHRLLLTALAALFTGRPAPPRLERELTSLHRTYTNADDLPGAANCTATLAVIAASHHDLPRARTQLTIAREEYSTGRPDHTPIPTGQALLTAINRILNRLAP